MKRSESLKIIESQFLEIMNQIGINTTDKQKLIDISGNRKTQILLKLSNNVQKQQILEHLISELKIKISENTIENIIKILPFGYDKVRNQLLKIINENINTKIIPLLIKVLKIDIEIPNLENIVRNIFLLETYDYNFFEFLKFLSKNYISLLIDNLLDSKCAVNTKFYSILNHILKIKKLRNEIHFFNTILIKNLNIRMILIFKNFKECIKDKIMDEEGKEILKIFSEININDEENDEIKDKNEREYIKNIRNKYLNIILETLSGCSCEFHDFNDKIKNQIEKVAKIEFEKMWDNKIKYESINKNNEDEENKKIKNEELKNSEKNKEEIKINNDDIKNKEDLKNKVELKNNSVIRINDNMKINEEIKIKEEVKNKLDDQKIETQQNSTKKMPLNFKMPFMKKMPGMKKKTINLFDDDFINVKWKKIEPNGQIWKNIKWEDLHSKFSRNDFLPFVKKLQKKTEVEPKIKIITIFSPKKGNAIAIALGRIKIPDNDFINSVIKIETKHINENILNQLIKNYPNADEIEQLKSMYESQSFNNYFSKTQIGRAERFYLNCIPYLNDFFISLKFLKFSLTFENKKSEIIKKINILKNQLNKILNCNEILNFLKTCLYVGNVLNNKSYLGKAEAFSLESIKEFLYVKDEKNKNIFQLIKSKIDCKEILKTLKEIDLCCSIDIDGLKHEKIDLKNEYEELGKYKSLEKLYLRYKNDMNNIENNYESFNESVNKFSDYFGLSVDMQLFSNFQKIYYFISE